jgi:hypothetical protein
MVSSDEIKLLELRNMTTAERKERFQAWTRERRVIDSPPEEETRWHVVDEDMTPNQVLCLPYATPGTTVTPTLWAKFRHRHLKVVVVSEDRFDHDGGCWSARLSPIEDQDRIARVDAIAWAQIVAGTKPWEGPMIRRNEADPW